MSSHQRYVLRDSVTIWPSRRVVAVQLVSLPRGRYSQSRSTTRTIWGPTMSTAEILAELARLSPEDRRRILNRILELEDEAEAVEAARRTADEAFLMLDAMEAEDAASESR